MAQQIHYRKSIRGRFVEVRRDGDGGHTVRLLDGCSNSLGITGSESPGLVRDVNLDALASVERLQVKGKKQVSEWPNRASH